MTRHYRRQQGLSLVELMVGVTIGLFIVAAASLLIASQLHDNRRLLAETQLQQDMRASADIITRQLRRSGSFNRAETAVANPALSPAAGVPQKNDFLDLTVTAGTAGSIAFNYQRPPAEPQGPYGYRLQNGVVQTRLAQDTGWQDLTDKNVLFVEELEITTASAPNPPRRLPCPVACPTPVPPGETADYCYPTVAVRELTVRIRGRAVADPAVRREVSSQVRLRNDDLRFNFDNGSGLQACPT